MYFLSKILQVLVLVLTLYIFINLIKQSKWVNPIVLEYKVIVY